MASHFRQIRHNYILQNLLRIGFGFIRSSPMENLPANNIMAGFIFPMMVKTHGVMGCVVILQEGYLLPHVWAYKCLIRQDALMQSSPFLTGSLPIFASAEKILIR